jgi:outer membrane receptor protein involved in Fe transport
MISTGGRLSALWQATDKLDLSLTYLTQKIEQDGAPIASTGRYEQAHAPIAPQARARGETGETSDTDIDLVNLVLNYDLGWGALTTTASQVDSGSLLTADLLSAGFFMPASSSGPSDFKSFTAETRVASKLAGRFQFLGGLFYENIDEDFTQTVDWPGPTGTNPLGLFGLPVTDPIFISTSARELQQRAVFGELSYDLTAKLTATAGARYFKYDKDERTLTEGGLARLLIGAGTPVVLNSDEDNSSLKANLRYRPTDDATVYASWSEGFRLGHPAVGLATCDLDGDGVVDNSNISVASTQQVDSDALDNYEIGGKLALFGHRMLVDAAAYHIDWQGLPIAATVQGCSFGYTANAGSATSDGVELQASLQVVDGLRLDFGGAYTKAELSETSSLGEDGARLPGSPKVNANLAAEYNFKMAGHTAFVRADSLYVGKFYGDLAQTPATLAGDYIKVNAAAGVAIQNLSIELFVRNLTNEDAFTWRSSNITGNALNGYRLRPRTIGIQLAYSFE